MHDLFNVEKKGGLTELLLKGNNLTETIKSTKIHNVNLITSGIPHSNPSSIFDSRFLDSFIAQVKDQADWVLFDCAPINSYNDSCTLSTKVDGVIMVIQAENTRWQVAQRAKELIEGNNVKLLGVVLNKRKMYIPEWVYKML